MQICEQCGRDCPLHEYREAREAWQESGHGDRCYYAPTPENEKLDAERREAAAELARQLLSEMRATMRIAGEFAAKGTYGPA